MKTVKKTQNFSLIFLTLWSTSWAAVDILSSRTVTTAYGDLRGNILKLNNRALGKVERFLGVPYAAPPIGAFRFMPPSTPDKWKGVKRADSMPPVCPQKLPDVSNKRESLKRMPLGRYNYLQRLIPQLRNQSENCLFLNIYVPLRENMAEQSQEKLPVMVYIHGESYEWNSGNPYDGSVLASYGNVIVVTVNFRLGILGFLRPALNEKYVSNFGLLDQIAALHWVRGNIAAFRGDPQKVTIFGHGTGAALANLLLISPIAQASKGLFSRAILMSGSALSKWAFTWDPYKYTIQVAKALKCSLINRGDDLANCLRSKTVEELLAVPLETPPFTTPLGPILDGTVLKQDPIRLTLNIDPETFSGYDILYGATSAETFNILNFSEVKYGMSEDRRSRLLRAYISNTFDHETNAIYATVDNEYRPWNSTGQNRPGRRKEMELRDRILSILSDAQIVAPVVALGDLHSDLNIKSYFYVFNHQSLYGDYPVNQGAVHGEELPYVFGAPLVGGFSHFGLNYTTEESFLSELVMIHWTNFAKSGNPNLPTPQSYITEGAPFNWIENMRKMWPPYDTLRQQYLHIDTTVVTKSHYRAKKLAVWNNLIPKFISSSTREFPYPRTPAPKINLVPTMHSNFKMPPTATPPNKISPFKPETVPPVPPSYPKPMKSQHDWDKPEGDDFSKEPSEVTSSPSPPIYAGTPMSIIILIGIVILFLNCFAMAGFYYRREKNRFSQSHDAKDEQDASKDEDESFEHSKRSSLLGSETPASDPAKTDSKSRKHRTSSSANSGHDSYSSPDIFNESGTHGSSTSRESTLKRKQHTDSYPSLGDSKKTPGKDVGKSSTSISDKTSKYVHKRHKSENSIYSEISAQSSPEATYSKNSSVKFLVNDSLSPKNLNKSSNSITSIKSNSSRSSVKSSSSVKPSKKNASCQSLPTPEYCWGITREMTLPVSNTRSGDKFSKDKTGAAKSHKKQFQKPVPEPTYIAETHSSTLPKCRPPPPLRSTSLTSRDMEELEKMHTMFKKERDSGADAKQGLCDVTNMESFYETGAGEAPASPSGMYGRTDVPTATVRRSRKSDGFEYGQSPLFNQYLPYETYMVKETPKVPQPPKVPETAVKTSSYSVSKTPRGPFGNFDKSKSTSKFNYEDTKTMLKKSVNYSPNTSTTSSSPENSSPHSIHTTKHSKAHTGSQKYNSSREQQDSKLSIKNEPNIPKIYDQREGTDSLVRKKSTQPTKFQSTSPTGDKPLEKPLKSVLKTTSAYDKPKPNQSSSSMSSSASINLMSPSNTKYT